MVTSVLQLLLRELGMERNPDYVNNLSEMAALGHNMNGNNILPLLEFFTWHGRYFKRAGRQKATACITLAGNMGSIGR